MHWHFRKTALENINQKIKEHWHNLRMKVHEAKTDLKKYREDNEKPMSFPKEYEDKFLKIFY